MDPFSIIPFRFLGPETRARLAEELVERRVAAGTDVLIEGDEGDDDVWLLLEGSVEVVENRSGRRISVIDPGHYFGERRALFDAPRAFTVRALTDIRCMTLTGPTFLELLASSPSFAVGLAALLRNKQGLFRGFDRFVAAVRHEAGSGHIVIPRLLWLYRPLEPALHREANSKELDLSALEYVVRRLPEGTTRTLSWFLTDDLPPRLARADQSFELVPTQARRRTIYRLLPGKVVVVLRDGLSDLLDLVTCLCILSVEARKLRHKVDAGTLTETERAQLERLWPGRVEQELRSMALHHEDFAISVTKRVNDYNAAHGERWTAQIADATASLLGIDPHAVPEDFDVHIVSSNTHSVSNTLSPWLSSRADEIVAWGERAHPELCALHWPHPRDLVVALSRAWLDAHPEQRARRRVEEEQDGAVVTLKGTAFTGIEVQLVDLGRLAARRWDSAVPAPTRPGLLVNIDYAFGQQAEPIITNLLTLFGRNVRSVSVLGKAGGLVGHRGDVLVATSFVEQMTDTLVDPGCDIDPDALRARLPDRGVHVGRILTVAGTVLQNRTMLHFYSRLWGCVGLEMEGTWYAKRLLEARRLGVLSPDCALRFLYYVSDLPLSHGHSLSGAMTLHEGIPPLYAITREVLSRAFTAPR